ncbi:MAG: RagB/SusD family nutrient uptake outer membrane protein [Mangrovibacterium sp.]
MKLITKLIPYPFLIFLLCLGCEDLKFGDDFLEKRTSTDISSDTVFSSKIYAEQVLNEAYRSLPDGLPQKGRLGWGMLESFTDLGDFAKSGTTYAAWTASTAESSLPYGMGVNNGRGPFAGIRTAYTFIENVDRVPDMTTQEKEIRKAEAKMIIAFHYSQMFRYYGGMPWVDHAYTPSDDFYAERMTVEATVDTIVKILDQVSAVLPWKVEALDDGRMTKAAAMALKVRVLLFAASPLFNDNAPFLDGEAAEKKIVWYGNKDQARWQRALDAGLAFMEALQANGYWKLVNTGNPRMDFRKAYHDRGNGEVLISSRFVNKLTTGGIVDQQTRYGVCVPTLNLVDMFPMADGTDFSWDNPNQAAWPFFDQAGKPVRDVRLYESVIVNGDTYQGRKAECYVGGRENNTFLGLKESTGFMMAKFTGDRSWPFNQFYQWPLLRLPEVFLSIAEACNELNRGSEAIQYVNMVRERVGLPGLNPGMGQAELRDAILRERCLELAFEEARWFDLCRWKRSDIFKSTRWCRGMVFLRDAATGEITWTFRQTRYERAWINSWTDRFFLLPINQNELNKRKGMIQNPGW